MNVYIDYLRRVLPAVLLLPVFVAGCGGGSGGGGTGSGNGGSNVPSGPPDLTSPTVTSMTPTEDSAGNPTNGRLTATLSEAVVATDINGDNFRLTDGDIAIPGTVSYNAANHIAVFTPTGSLAQNQRYTATVITGIKDPSGNPLMTDFAWCFVTGETEDVTAPAVTSTSAANVSINQKISATFSEEMNASTLTPTNFTLTAVGIPAVSGTVRYHDRTAIFTPGSDLALNKMYTATITTGVKDLAGNAALVNVTWNFSTGANEDVTAPVVITSPADAATGVAVDTVMTASFNEPMDPITITTANFRLSGPDAIAVTGIVTYDVTNNTASFTRANHLITPVDFHTVPVSRLEPGTTYTATLTTGARDMAGNELESNWVWSFTTAP